MNRLSLCLYRMVITIATTVLFSTMLSAAPLAEFINYKAAKNGRTGSDLES